MRRNKTILVVDDEVAIRDMLRIVLEAVDYCCLEAADIQQAHTIIIDEKPNLVLLDWMLPGNSGIDLVRRLKKDEFTAVIPIIILTAKSEEDNKIQGLNMGADDYITKPFSPRELVARLKAVLRRSEGFSSVNPIEAGNLRMDLVSHMVTVNKLPLKIGPTEYRLLSFFLTHQDRVYSRGQLLDHVWGGNVYVEERTVDVHIRRLRKALCSHDKFIQTIRGAGYRFSVKLLTND